MFVCLCNAVTDREIREAVDNGVEHVDELGALCGVGTGCGGCRNFAQELIENRRSEELRSYAA
jgi:bacterioferritin-associated ferredoxin